MPWAKVDDGWWCHPKVMGLSLEARGLWTSALSWSCAQRRAEVPTAFLGMVGASEPIAAELVAAGLWDEGPRGYMIHDWAEYQDRSLAEKRADAGRKGGLTSGSSKQTASKPQASAFAATSKPQAKPQAGSLPCPSLPVPTQPLSVVDDGGSKRPTAPPAALEITEAMRAWATANGIRLNVLAVETENFLDHHRAKGTKHKDWTAAWRTWMRRAKGYRPEITKPVDDFGPNEVYR